MKVLNLKLDRIYCGSHYTIGRLYVDDKYFCDTLEDVVRDLNHDGDLDDPGEQKVYGETAIPYGRYHIEVTYSPKFKRLLPLILAVWGFIGIRIHKGRYPSHTSGCVLVGMNVMKGQVLYGDSYEKKLTKILHEHQIAGGQIYINVI